MQKLTVMYSLFQNTINIDRYKAVGINFTGELIGAVPSPMEVDVMSS